MGHVLAQMIEEKDGFALAGMVDPLKGESLADLDDVDVVIDFSNPANLPMVMAYCEENKCPAVIATTGFSDEETAKIQALGQDVPVVFSANYSLGINVMKRVVAEITPILEDTFDIEIIEKHHNKKLDAPSGTAKMLLSAADPDGAYDHVYGREGNRKRVIGNTQITVQCSILLQWIRNVTTHTILLPEKVCADFLFLPFRYYPAQFRMSLEDVFFRQLRRTVIFQNIIIP